MVLRNLSLISSAALPIVASIMLLTIARVSQVVLLIQILSVCLAACMFFAGRRFITLPKLETIILRFIPLTLFALAIPLIGTSSEPERWIRLGGFKLYIASVLLPSLLVIGSVALKKSRRKGTIAVIGLSAASCLLAAQPDASQVLALSIGTSILLLHRKPNVIQSSLCLLVLTIASAWAFLQPDRLQPIAYVEGVFALALSQSIWMGAFVIASAVSLIAGLCWESQKDQPWLWSVAAYYSILYGCSLIGLTPAPLIGFGSGPILGFGLMALLSNVFKDRSIDRSVDRSQLLNSDP